MAEDYTLSFPSHYQYPKHKKAVQNYKKSCFGPGENVIQFLLAYDAALYSNECSGGICIRLLMN
jgi:hypothetical protein